MIFRVQKTKDYTTMSNHHLKNKELSLKAKGLLSFMLSLPEDWDYSIEGLISVCKESETAIKSTLKELKKFGYLEIKKILPCKETKGKIDYVYNIFEVPNNNQNNEIQEGGFQPLENQPLEVQPLEVLEVENQGQINTNKQNTNKQNTKRLNNNNNNACVRDKEYSDLLDNYNWFEKKED